MPMWTLTYEKVEELKKQVAQKEIEIQELKNTSEKTMWKKDLNKFIEVLDEVEEQEEKEMINRLSQSKSKLK